MSIAYKSIQLHLKTWCDLKLHKSSRGSNDNLNNNYNIHSNSSNDKYFYVTIAHLPWDCVLGRGNHNTDAGTQPNDLILPSPEI